MRERAGFKTTGNVGQHLIFRKTICLLLGILYLSGVSLSLSFVFFLLLT